MRQTPAALALILAALPLTAGAQEADDYAKLGPNAVSLTDDHAWLATHPAPDFWAIQPFTKPQFTDSACSIASVTAALNGLRGLPQWASQTVMTQEDLLDLTGNAEWAALSAQDGDGVTFAQLESFTAEAARAAGLTGAAVTAWQPGGTDEATLADLRARLAANEETAADALLVYFNQGVVTGDWDGPHISPIGAYDAAGDRVLILEVDQGWYVSYWTPVPVLLEAMVRPVSEEHGPLAGGHGGLVRIGTAG
ncbi:MAG: hypothetical protein IT542_12205 [Rubellimicrobium sp.]|nr:hypothetical protein [Rubellimicrobium sp.]